MLRKIDAKKEMLKQLKKKKREESYEPKKEDMKKNLKKVTVMSDSKEGMEKGLSMAEKIMKGKSADSDGEDFECGGGRFEEGGVSNYDELKEEDDKYKKKKK